MKRPKFSAILPGQAKRVLDFLNEATDGKDITDIRSYRPDLPQEALSKYSIGQTSAQNLLTARNSLPGKKFIALDQVLDVASIGEEKILDIIEIIDWPTQDQNTDELDLKTVVESSPGESEDIKMHVEAVKKIYLQFGENMISEVDALLNNWINPALRNTKSWPQLEAVPKVFDQLMSGEKPEDYIPVMEDMNKNSILTADELISAKFTYEKKTHKNQNDYTQSCIKAGSELEGAKTEWNFAVSNYYEETQHAEWVLLDAIYTARRAHKDTYNPNADLESKLDYYVDYFSEASEIVTAWDVYGNSMNKANTTLATSYSTLINSFNKNWNAVSAAELKLITDNRKDSQTLWTSIQTYYKKKFGDGRA